MSVDHVKSTFITNSDASPSVQNTAGEGGSSILNHVEGSAIAVASSSVDATYQLVRLPSNCKLKSLIFESAAQTAGKFDIGAYYATDGLGGRPAALLAAAAISQAFFAAAVDCASAVVRTDILNSAGNYTIDKRTQPLWQALGLSTDPGGNIDIVATVKTTAVTTGTGRFGLSASFTT
jgi:hypothetical protein